MGEKVNLKRIASKLSPLRLIFRLARTVTTDHRPASERKPDRLSSHDAIHKEGPEPKKPEKPDDETPPPDDDKTPHPTPPRQARRRNDQ